MTRTIVLTGHGSVVHGVRALESGAASFLEKPADLKHLAALTIDAIAQARLRREYSKLVRQKTTIGLDELIGESASIRSVKEQLIAASRSSLPLLITGETGTGKGVCARLVHQLSDRATKAFVRYQPNYGSGDLVASELFGHVKGAFTGAVENRTGLFREADAGTLFLDEVDEVSVQVQVLLLESLQEGTIRPIGSSKIERCDVRCISAFNKPIDEVLSTGRLRQDFFHRIAHISLHIPALRERREDIPMLVAATCRNAEDRQKLPPISFSTGAMELLLEKEWPGNVRELQAVVERGCVQAWLKGRVVVEAGDLGFTVVATSKAADFGTLGSRVERLKFELVGEALKRNRGNQVVASRELGIDRKTLRKIVRQEND